MTPQNLHTPQNIRFCEKLKTPKNIEIQNFEPKKMTRAYVCMKILEYFPVRVIYNRGGSRISEMGVHMGLGFALQILSEFS